MSKNHQANEACLCAGDVGGEGHEVEAHYPEGVTCVRKRDGKRVFYSEHYLTLMRLRNRGRD